MSLVLDRYNSTVIFLSGSKHILSGQKDRPADEQGKHVHTIFSTKEIRICKPFNVPLVSFNFFLLPSMVLDRDQMPIVNY